MGLRLQQFLGPPWHLEAAQYTNETASGRPAICCPLCSAVSELPETHTVSPGGVVTPIWVCPNDACPCIEWLNLETE